MANSALEILGMLLTLIGLIGAAATTGMPMWRVTAFIGENIIVFETRYEGLWMNCFRQADIRMQCKVYDSLLFLPADLQAARGLVCCSLALSGLGLLVALAGMRCISCVQGNERAKVVILMAAGGMQLVACVCILIPVSWTGHVIIRDFYNPLLIDAQRRELGEALYIGWVTGAFLFASGCLFACRRLPEDKGAYHQGVRYPQMRYDPVSSVSTGPLPPSAAAGHGLTMQPAPYQDNRMAVPFHPNGQFYPVESGGHAVFPPVPMAHSSGGHYLGSVPTRETSVYASHPSTSLYTLQPMPPMPPMPPMLAHHPSMSSSQSQYTVKPSMPGHQPHSMSTYTGSSSFHPVPQNPLFIRYHESRVDPGSNSGTSRGGVYI
ncbi:unnamed protein product [Gadus morhua 'NCC']